MGTDFIAFLSVTVLAIADFIRTMVSLLPFSTATWFVVGILAFSVMIFFKASKNPNSPIHWEDMLIDHTNGKTSPYKLGFLIGVVVSTWVVITLLDQKNLGLDILGAYLAYLVGGAGFTEWLKHGKEPAIVPKDET
jgi:hypothetical protein